MAGLTPLTADYLTAGEALAWTVAGIAVSHVEGSLQRTMVRVGTALAPVSVMASIVIFPAGSVVVGVGLAGVIFGAGFGLS